MRNPEPYIIENHKLLVLSLLDMSDENSEEARQLRARIRDGNGNFKELELLYVEIMASREESK